MNYSQQAFCNPAANPFFIERAFKLKKGLEKFNIKIK